MKLRYSHTLLLNKEVRQTKSWTCPSVLQGGYSNRHPNIKQDQKSTKTLLDLRHHMYCKISKTLSQNPNLTVGNFNSVIPNTPNITENSTNGNKCTNSYHRKAQNLDSKLKKIFFPGTSFSIRQLPKLNMVTNL